MHNLANLTQKEKDKVNVDLAASGVAYKERLVLPHVMLRNRKPTYLHLLWYFIGRMEHYREIVKRLPRWFKYEKE
ncbi:DNA polymerase III subunit theta [Providencia stuartii]